MGPITKMFGVLVFFCLFWLFFLWGHKFFPAYLGCVLWGYMVFYMMFHKEPPEGDQNEQKKP